ncbi:MAG: hypothetical protein H7839_08070 [Magnetococcus sp. YQC-5]
MRTGPREIVTPRPKMPMQIPEGMSAVEFFNSAANLEHLARENGLLINDEGFLMYRKLLGHSIEFDTSIMLDTSKKILDPLGRPVRRDQLTKQQKKVWSRMTQIILSTLLEKYPDPDLALILCGEASLDATWPLSKPGVPSIRMIHNHFIVFPTATIADAPLADPHDANLTDAGHNGLFLHHLSDVYRRFFEILHLEWLRPVETDQSRLALTGFPQGLPSWEVVGGGDRLGDPRFWEEYDLILKGFLDFYRTFFAQVSTRGAGVPTDAYFPDQIENILLFDNHFAQVARDVRNRVKADPRFANEIRWRPAYKQILYRDDQNRLIVTISQNSVGNAITELLGIVIRRQEDEAAYRRIEPALVGRLLEVRKRLIDADLGEPVHAPGWPEGRFVSHGRD